MATLLVATFVYRGSKYEAMCDYADWDNSETSINRVDGKDVGRKSRALRRAADAAIEAERKRHHRDVEDK